MKKSVLMLLPLAAFAAGCSDDDPNPIPEPKVDVINFETCEFPGRQSNNCVKGEITTYTELGADFTNVEYYSYFGGAIVSSGMSISTDGNGIPKQICVALDAEKAGADGSEKYGFFVYDSFIAQTKKIIPLINFTDGSEHEILSAYFMNSTQMDQFFKYGFYSNPGLSEGDYVTITIKGADAQGNETGSVEILLADFRDGKEFIMSQWTETDLQALGKVNKISFEIDTHGWVIPNGGSWSICADNITFKAEEEQ